jgi:hypothetical protein
MPRTDGGWTSVVLFFRHIENSIVCLPIVADCVLLLGSRFKVQDWIVSCNIEHVIIVIQMEDPLRTHAVGSTCCCLVS